MQKKIFGFALFSLAIFLFFCFSGDSSQQRWFVTGQNADLMLSGVDFNNTGGALMFNHPSDIASDGVHFLLCDRFNNRVLVWNTLPSRWDAQPDLVLGQRNFTENNPGTSKSGMNWPGNVSVGSNGRVAVADTENDRILIWNIFPTQSGQSADISISLAALPGPNPFSPYPYSWPWGVWTNGTKLVAVATRNTPTLLFWNSLTNVDDQAPDYKINLPQFGTPRDISTDGVTYFFVGDHNAMVNGDQPGTFFWNSFPQQENQPYDFYRDEWIKGSKLPNGQLAAGGLWGLYLWASMPTSAGQNPVLKLQNAYYDNSGGSMVLFAGGRLYANSHNGNNVQVFNGIPTSSNQLPDFALGSPSIDINTLDTLNILTNPNVSTDGMAMFVAGGKNLWIWKSLPQRSGQAPDVKINFGNTYGLDLVGTAAFGGKLVAARYDRIVVWNSLPLNGEVPSYIIQGRIGSVVLDQLKGVALDKKFFYLAKADGTISIWQGIPQTGNETPYVTIAGLDAQLNQLRSDGTYLCAASLNSIVYIFRVSDIEGGGTIQPFKTIQNPPLGAGRLWLNMPTSAITFNDSLAIANMGNNSVFLWENLADAGDLNRAIVLGQLDLTSVKPAIGVNRLFQPAFLAAYQNRLWVGEFKFSSRILQFSRELPTSSVRIVLSALTGGTTDPGPGTYAYSAEKVLTITALPDSRHEFLGWTGDIIKGYEKVNPLTLTLFSDTALTAQFAIRNVTVVLATTTGGTTDPTPGSRAYPAGTVLTITAIPDRAYEFSGWTGDIAQGQNMTNPLTLTLDSNISLTAQFVRGIFPPSNFNGAKVLNRSLSQVEYINSLTWAANPDNANVAKYRLFKLEGANQTLITELNPNVSKYSQRGVQKNTSYVYLITAVNTDGRESAAASVTIQ